MHSESKYGNLMCWFKHKWKIIKIFNYYDTSFEPGQGIASHEIIYQCTKCNKVKYQNKYGSGHLSMDDIYYDK